MSFYGKVTYYLSNAFKAIVYDNGSSSATTTVPQTIATAPYTLIPRDRDDQTKLIAYNKWIRFGGDESMSNNNQVYIFHAVTGQGGVLTPAASDSSSGTTIDFGKTFSIPSITFDQAGHITSGSLVNFKIADPPGLGDLDAIVDRIDSLEETVQGSDNPNSIVRQLESLKTVTQDWQLKNSQTPNTNKLKESEGIGTTLHELMVLIGTRLSGDDRKYTENGVEHQGYEEYNYADAIQNPSTIIGMANSALSLVTGVSRSNHSQLLGIRALMDYLVSSGSLGSADAERLRTDFFYLGNNQT